MNVNRILHEAMGLKWREITVEKREFKLHSSSSKFIDFICKCCDGPQSGCKNVAPDYTAPVHYCALMDWMREENRNAVFVWWACRKGTKRLFSEFFEKFNDSTNQNQITLIAEAIEAGVLK